MGKKVKIQDIADALGLSRNTVSKALNNTGILADATKKQVIQKASEMGYKQFYVNNDSDFVSQEDITEVKEIAIFSHSILGNAHFGSQLLTSFQKAINKQKFKLVMYSIDDEHISNKSLPKGFDPNINEGIIVIELFDKTYCNFLCSQPIPTLLIDSYASVNNEIIQSDILYMENYKSTYTIISDLINRGLTKFSFIGDRYNCQSFYERWKAYNDILALKGLNNEASFSIMDIDSDYYHQKEWIKNKIKSLPIFPEVFICANDSLAIDVIMATKEMSYIAGKDYFITGFDDSVESRIVSPPLTTVRIPSMEMGKIAADMILYRIKNPNSPFRILYTETKPIYRESTNIN